MMTAAQPVYVECACADCTNIWVEGSAPASQRLCGECEHAGCTPDDPEADCQVPQP